MTLWVASVSVGMGASQRIPSSVLAQNQTQGLHARSPMRPEGQGKEGPREQSAEGSWREQSVREVSQEKSSQQKGAVYRTGQSGDESGREETSQQKSERWLLGPVDLQMPDWPTWEDKSALLVALWEFSLVHAYVSSQNAQKVSQTSLPCAWS